MAPKPRPPLDRFTARLVEDDGCLVWTGARDKDGYPLFQLGVRRLVRGHRWWWEQHHGPIPPGLIVRHGCDRPPCVRHLELGTHADNAQDRQRRGRAAPLNSRGADGRFVRAG